MAEATRVRVLAAIEELGFVRNEAARTLRKGSGRTLGVIVEDLAGPCAADLVRGVERACDTGGYDIIWCTSDGDPEKERRRLDFLEQQGVSGVIVAPVALDADRVARLRARDIRTVLLDRRMSGTTASSVGVDHRQGGRLATRHLVELGRHDIAFVTTEPEPPPVRQRRGGALQSLGQAGYAPEQVLTIAEQEPTAQAGQRAARRLLEFGTLPTGVFCVDDLLAVGLVNELTRNGVKIPQDVAVVGYGDIAPAATCVVPLTTVRQPRDELGAAAAELLMDEAEGRHLTLAPELVVRDSAS
ncbi:LacI family DNA-binding transcriptional regulator [Actinocorallia libanotica]|uniref:LacI family DNA-binding transcriptional regulator n=1 Tax=Actinocorallia libanotica TaxID=46162 RepID=A0ABP4C9L9_9ACTN